MAIIEDRRNDRKKERVIYTLSITIFDEQKHRWNADE
jgi:hypothetical protein